MFRSALRLHLLCSALALASLAGGCSGGCDSPFKPLPKPLPPSQIVEGGVQVRVTKSGLVTVINTLKTVLNSTILKSGICIPQQIKLDPGTALPYLDLCYGGDCNGGGRGCKVTGTLGTVSSSVVDSGTLRVDATVSAATSVPVHAYYTSPFGNIDLGSCRFSGGLSNLHAVADVSVGIGANGELALHLKGVSLPGFDTKNLDISGSTGLCDFIADVATFLTGIFKTFIGDWILGLLTPALDGFIQGFLPQPLGLEGLLDVGSFLQALDPGASGTIEVHAVPGGFATLPAQGISVGVNVGLNADRDPATRSGADASEPSLCMPQWTAPDLSAPPASLTRTTRNTFALKAAGAFLGSPDPASDVAIGVSQTVLDLAGHHITSAGTLCLSVGSDLAPQLNLGTIGLLVKSLAELGQGKEPILLALRPTAPITFDIGEGTTASPYVTAHLRDLEIDFYALLFETYIRAFTVGASVDLGVNLVFMLDKNHKAVIVPTLVGLDATKIKVKVSNTDLIREAPAQLEVVFPTLLNLVLPLLSQAIPDLPVPVIQGFTLGDLKLGHVQTTQDDFLTIYASLAKASGKPEAAEERAVTTARVVRVTAPSPAAMRLAFAREDGGALPEIELELGGAAPRGAAPGSAPLEWQWNLDGGMWRPFSADAHVVLRDPALALQGKHAIGVRARVVGRGETTDVDGVSVDVIIDSVAPRLDATATVRAGDEVVVRALDLVSDETALGYALGAPDALAPATAYAQNQGRFPVGDVRTHAQGGAVQVFVRDEVGNVAAARLEVGALLGPTPAPVEAGGCAVAGHGLSHAPGAVFVAGLLVALRLRRRRPLLAAALLAGCASNNVGPAIAECTLSSECASKCPAGQVGVCGPEMTCSCVEDIPVGTVGTHANLAAGSSGTAWISAYNSTFGDLVVAQAPPAGRVPAASWEFVDGVPAGPVVLPGSKVRGGVRAPGDDVGLYTSIAVTPAGEPVVAYYDRTHTSLRFAQKVAGRWTAYAIDTGVPDAKDLGRYTAITVDAMGRPGIAYLALLKDSRGQSSEVRFVQATRAQPASQADWTQLTIESKAMPAPTAADSMVDDLPKACGLFIASARTAAGAPLVAYYDRPAGALKLAEYDPGASAFKRPVVLDGGGTEDAGWYPSLAVAPDGTVHVGYVDAGHQNLLATTFPAGTPEVVDDGYRVDGTTAGGTPRPVFHHVGDNSAIVDNGKVRAIVYQDATTQDLLVATAGAAGKPWTHATLAGSETPYKGAYGFYAAAALAGSDLIVSTFALNQTTSEQWVEVFRQKLP